MQQIEIYHSKYDSVSRLITGFHLLEQAKQAKCIFIENVNNSAGLPSSEVVEVRTEGKRIAFDMGDRSMLNHQSGILYLEGVDMYFERSHDPDLVNTLPLNLRHKVRPFGFNYYTTFPGNPAENSPKTVAEKLKYATRVISGYQRCMHVDAFEKKAEYKESNLNIIFMARLWDPHEIVLDKNLPREVLEYRKYMIEERNIINRDRIEIIRTLKQEFPDAFTGGIQDSAYAATQCPDIILPRSLTRKRVYIRAMQNADICIGSTGLHRSIGWKTGEYVASSRAIIAERLQYVVPGGFEEGKNYIPFDNAQECIDAVHRLSNDPEAVYQMKLANELYYSQYLRPEQQIINAMNQCDLIYFPI